MDPLFLLSLYEKVQKVFPWLPDPDTNLGKKRIKFLIAGSGLFVLSFMIVLVTRDPEKIEDYGFISGKIEKVEMAESKSEHKKYLSVTMKLENIPGTYTYYFHHSEIGNQIRPNVGDSALLGILKTSILKGAGRDLFAPALFALAKFADHYC